MSRGPGDFDGAMPDYDYARGEAGDIGPVTNKANNSPFRIVQYSNAAPIRAPPEQPVSSRI